MCGRGLFLVLLVAAARAAPPQRQKAVHVSVAAPWSATPLVLEAGEFFASADAGGDGQLFWQYAAALPVSTAAASDKGQYDAALATAEPLLSAGQLDLLKYALAIRQFSPKVQAHRELWQEAEALGCSIEGATAVAIVNGKDCVTDPVAGLKKAIKAARKTAEGEDAFVVVPGLDHEYKGTNGTSEVADVVVQLYATIGSESFLAFHKELSKRAEKKRVQYILRHLWPQGQEKQMLVQGYGVELAIKNMEYKAVDDQKKEGGASAAGDGDEEADEVAGFDFKVLLQRKPEREVELLSLRDALLSEARAAESTDIKVWALKDLGVQASQRILQSDEPLRLIRDLSHNLPALVNSISRMRVNATIKNEIENNRNYMQPGTNLIYVNGRQLHLDALTPYNLYDFVEHETKMMDALQRLGLDARSSRRLLNAPGEGGMEGMGGGEESSFKLDVKDEAHVFWVNDIEADDVYKQWPASLQALLQRGWPGQLRYVRRNLWTAIYMVDVGSMSDLEVLSDALNMVYHQLPVRFGFIFKTSALADEAPPAASPPAAAAAAPESDGEGGEAQAESASGPADEGVAFYRLFRALYSRHGNKAAFDFADGYWRKAAHLENDGRRAVLKEVFKATAKRHRTSKAKAKYARDLKSPEGDASLRASSAFARDTGVAGEGVTCVLNGMVLQGAQLDDQNFHYLLQVQMQELQRMTYFGQLDEARDIYDQFINHGGAAHRRFHKRIVPGRESSTQVLRLHGALSPKRLADKLGALPARLCGSDTGAARPVTHLVAADLGVAKGCQLVVEAATRLSLGDTGKPAAPPADDAMCPHVRVLLLDTSEGDSQGSEAMGVLQEMMVDDKASAADLRALAHTVCKALKAGEWSAAKAASHVAPLVDKAARRAQGKPASQPHIMPLSEQRELAAALLRKKSALRKPSGAVAVATSGRVFAVDDDTSFVASDFKLAETTEWQDRSEHVSKALEAASWPGLSADEVTSTYVSNVALAAAAAISQERNEHIVRRDQEANRQWQSKVSGFHVGPKLKDALLHTVAFIDPLCNDAQRMAPILMALAGVFKAHVHVILNPVSEMGSLPIKGYYRFVLKPELEFNADGSVASNLRATFSNLPVSKLLSMNLHPPNAWFVSAADCVHDMDNVLLEKLPAHETALVASYRLDHLLLTGHCIDDDRQPPAGLQLNLHTPAHGGKAAQLVGDTLVMSNLGYFQLKARPGMFNLSLAEGRSRDIYQQLPPDDSPHPGPGHASTDARLVSLASWEPEALSLRVRRRPSMQGARLLESMQDGQDGGGESGEDSLWSAMGSMFGMGGSEGPAAGKKGVALSALPSGKDHDTIHVFSLASGHLYERFLKIMMLSVVSNTKAPVKFWLLNNFLSPQFKKFIPRMARKHGFEYELVTYKWPSWLHQQTEKQRIIWGYKILMLDVLFPLSVKKIIYIDSDQTVRGDLRELYNMDLKGRPYAYTPFCDSNTEMEGYRFWKQGFWQGHLGASNYHISALYVVDLQRFRQIGAGDQLRVIYSQLSRDPNSLANLDQDLPNYAQHQVPIFSLPQEWLWCETWCSNSSKAEAKTIDLCNNPMTKEPKLDQARRIVGEWEDLDARVRASEEETCSSES